MLKQTDLEALKRIQGDGYWYLATPYSKYPDGIEMAFRLACLSASELVREGIRVYCPIAHTHPIAMHGNMDPYDHGLWMSIDAPFMEASVGLLVVMMRSWQESKGIQMEIREFTGRNKPVHYIDCIDGMKIDRV